MILQNGLTKLAMNNIDIIIDSLPKTKGNIQILPLSKLCWFRVGGNGIVFSPSDENDLEYFLKNKPSNIKIYPMGLGSNTLVRDGGYDGVIIRLNNFNKTCVKDTTISTGAGNSDLKIAKLAMNNNISGFEFLSGIPGCIGGAIVMNAGAYGNETSDIFVSAQGFDYQGNKLTLSKEQMNFSYRHCDYANNVIFTSATFQGKIGKKEEINKKMQEINISRTNSQPIKSRTGGSTFRNPDNYKAWELIDKVNLRGKVIGGAQISEQHCNFLINQGSATSYDLEKLGELAKNTVKSKLGIDLNWEIKRIGKYE